MSAMLQQTLDLVRVVGDTVVMPLFLNTARLDKADGSVLTEADLATQAALIEGLQAIAAVPVVGEEMTAEEQQKNWQDGVQGLWCIDPIDGTSNYVNGLAYFAISVAYMRAGRPVLGVIYAPATGELFYAEAGRGAYLDYAGQHARLPLPIHAAEKIRTLDGAIAEIEFKRISSKLASALVQAAPYQSQRNLGSSALDWCYLAAGRFDIYLHGGQKLWDYAAGCLIFAEAGGLMASDAQTDFWSGDLWQKPVVAACNASLFDQWRAWLVANS